MLTNLIKSALSKIAQVILIITLVYTGSFVLMEETSEKTEKTEKSEEALHSIYHSQAFMRSIALKQNRQKRTSSRISFYSTIRLIEHPVNGNFNVDYIYTISYLDSHI
ncbi:hypothetical protein [Ekhidna sp.]